MCGGGCGVCVWSVGFEMLGVECVVVGAVCVRVCVWDARCGLWGGR